MNVPLQRKGVAVIQVASKGLRLEFVGELFARLDHAGAGHAVHSRGVDAVKMDRVWVTSRIEKPNA